MIARSWSTGVDPSRVAEYEDFARHISLPMFRSMPGCLGVLMYRADDCCTVLTLWRSERDIGALDASPLYRDTVDQIVARGFLQGSAATQLHQLHLAWVDQDLATA